MTSPEPPGETHCRHRAALTMLWLKRLSAAGGGGGAACCSSGGKLQRITGREDGGTQLMPKAQNVYVAAQTRISGFDSVLIITAECFAGGETGAR